MNPLRYAWLWFCGKIDKDLLNHEKMLGDLDQSKIDAKIEKLKELGQGDWEEVSGTYWYTEIFVSAGTDVAKVQPSGLPIKIFISKLTGELKTFPARIFDKDFKEDV